jgi:hypothetical protein
LQYFSPYGQGCDGIASEPKGITNEMTNRTTKELLQMEQQMQ